MLIFNFWGRMSAEIFFLLQFFISLGKPKFDIISFFLGHLILGESCFYSQWPQLGGSWQISVFQWDKQLKFSFFTTRCQHFEGKVLNLYKFKQKLLLLQIQVFLDINFSFFFLHISAGCQQNWKLSIGSKTSVNIMYMVEIYVV